MRGSTDFSLRTEKVRDFSPNCTSKNTFTWKNLPVNHLKRARTGGIMKLAVRSYSGFSHGHKTEITKGAILIMGFVDLLKERAKKSIKTIVLPETEDMRTLEATDKILKEGVAKIVLIGNEEEINKKAAEGGFDISGATIVDPETSDRTQAYIDKFVELRAKKGMTPEKAKEILHTQYP